MQLCSAVHEHAFEILEGQMMQQDAVMSQLAQELDNGRLLRLLARLVMVSEGSPALEPNWSETGQHTCLQQVCPECKGCKISCETPADTAFVWGHCCHTKTARCWKLCVNMAYGHHYKGSCGVTGDRYLIKLFRDFVFNQVNQAGGPLFEWGHVVEALNKLDLGVNEKIMLLSRDEMSMLLVSYSDIKQCMNSTFKELESRASQRHD